jgi:pSer/pThr/pTyr-binding forkhead associated (FHA) protein
MRTPIAFLLAFGLIVGLALIGIPLYQARRSAGATSSGGPRPQNILELAPLRSGSKQPVGKLIDVTKVSLDGLLPFSVDKRHMSIGRDSSNDVVIPRETVSSFHGTIDFVDGYFYVEDHRSTNGSYLNGERLSENQAVQLKSGDRIDFAEFEFRFIIPDHEPRGRTVVLERSSVKSEMPEAESGAAAAETVPPLANSLVAFEQCLGRHLDKVRSLGPDYREFVTQNFDETLLHALGRKAEELISEVRVRGEARRAELTLRRVHYTLCVMQSTMDDAAAVYMRDHGGYATFLVDQLERWASDDRECDTLCVITFAPADEAWISITVVPARDDVSSVELMSFEFLSEEERRRALSLDIVEVGRVD